MSILEKLREITGDETLYWERSNERFRLWSNKSNIQGCDHAPYIIAGFELFPFAVDSSVVIINLPYVILKYERQELEIIKLLKKVYEKIAFNLGYNTLLASVDWDRPIPKDWQKNEIHLFNKKNGNTHNRLISKMLSSSDIADEDIGWSEYENIIDDE